MAAAKKKFIICNKLSPTKDDMILSMDHGIFTSEDSAAKYVMTYPSLGKETYILELQLVPVSKVEVVTTKIKETIKVK